MGIDWVYVYRGTSKKINFNIIKKVKNTPKNNSRKIYYGFKDKFSKQFGFKCVAYTYIWTYSRVSP